jgi:hypothetical protein
MEKRTYIQPKTSMAVMPKYAMMGFQPSPTINPAPKRRTPVF